MHLAEGTCPKCGWKAPAGLLKCPFCKTYIRKPGSSSSTELKVPDAATLAKAVEPTPAETAPAPAAPDPTPKPPEAPDPATVQTVVKKVTREVSRALFDDSDALRALERSDPLDSDVSELPPETPPS